MYTDYHIIDFSIIPSAMRFDICDTRQHQKRMTSRKRALLTSPFDIQPDVQPVGSGAGAALGSRSAVDVSISLIPGRRTSEKDLLITMQGSGSALADTRDAKTRRTAAVSCAGLKNIMVAKAVARMVSLEALGTASSRFYTSGAATPPRQAIIWNSEDLVPRPTMTAT